MARLRVFLLTYRRPHLLRRALRSLLAQTYRDWVCELHNDAPDDDTPRTVLAEMAPGDSRFVYAPHARNLGAVGTFNLVFEGGPEPFASLLEDDNTWEPHFLETLVAVLERHPAAAMAWANMHQRIEQPDGSWLEIEQTLWPVNANTPPLIVFDRPEWLQAFDAIHSTGAMVFRPNRFRTSAVPAHAPLAIIEPLRERAAAGPLLFVTKPLAHFARTQQTARDGDPLRWLQAKLLIAASFFADRPIAEEQLRQLWASRRALRPRDTGMLFLLAIALGRAELVRPARLGDWTHFLLNGLRHPINLIRSLQFRRAFPETWAWLEVQTAATTGSLEARLLEKSLQPRPI